MFRSNIPPEDLPDGWCAKQLRDVATIHGGGRLGLTKADYVDEGITAYSAAGPDGFVAQQEGAEPSIILSSIGARCGKSFLTDGPWATLANTQVITPDRKVADASYLIGLLDDEGYWNRSGSAQPFIKPSDVKGAWVPLPPLDEQRRIAEVLRSVDEAIAAQRATVDQHTRLMDAVFEAWSNQLAPMVAIGDLLDLKNGINFEKDERAGAGTLTLDVMNMFSPDMTPNYEGAYRISRAVPSDLILQSGDVLFVRSSVKQQGVGWTSLADGFVENTTFCGFIIRGRPKRADVLSRYVVGVLRAPKYRRWLIQHSTRSALTNINQKTIASAEIPLPTIEQQQRLVEQYEQLAHAAFEASAALAKLERLRVDLANDLLTGHVRVPA